MKLLRSYFLFLPTVVMLLLSFSGSSFVHADTNASDISISAAQSNNGYVQLTGVIPSPVAGATYSWVWRSNSQILTDINGNPATSSSIETKTDNNTPNSTNNATITAVATANLPGGSVDTHTGTAYFNFVFDSDGNFASMTTGTSPSSSGSSGTPAPGTGTSVTCGTDTTICNPVSGAQNLQDLLVIIIKYMLGMIGIVAVLMIIWGGYQLVTSAGNPEGFKKAKQTLMYAIGGLLLAVLSYSIVSIVENAIIHQK